MARGWESKSVEEQQQQKADSRSSEKPRLTTEQADQLREIQALRLSLQRVLDQLERSRDPKHQSMLQHAKADLELRLKKLAVTG
jgi:hypothetical protein